jgi:hypothetical protein
MTGLKDVLERGLPDAPRLDGLAGRAESAARRRRVRRRAGLVTGVVLVVASVGAAGAVSRPDAVPQVADGTDPADTVEPSSPPTGRAAGKPVRCTTARPIGTLGTARVTGVASVRLCRTGRTTTWAPEVMAQEPVTTDLTTLVMELNHLSTMDVAIDCVGGPAPGDQEIQVGYADGTARSFSTQLVCGASFRAVVAQLGTQESARLAAPDAEALRCPTLAVKDSFPPATESLTRLPAVAGVLCRYPEGAEGSAEAIATVLDAEHAEQWRLGILGAHYEPAMTRCTSPASQTVKVHLRVADGDVHELTVGPCGDTWLDRTSLGLADRDGFVSGF